MDENTPLDPLSHQRRVIGRNIAARRAYLGLSQEQVANQLRVDRHRVSRWERGDRPVPAEYVPPLARLFAINIESIYREPQ